MTSPVTADEAAAPKAQASRVTNRLRDWFVYRIPSILVWIWIVLRFTGRRLPFESPFHQDYLVLPFLIAWVLLILARRWMRAVFYFPYLILFPVSALTWICWWVFMFFKTTLVVPVQAFRIARSGAAIFITFMAIVAGWTVTLLGSQPTTRAVAALSAHIGTYLLFLQSFRWASNPYRPLLAFIEFVSKKGLKFLETTYVNPGMKDVGDKRRNAIDICNWGLKWLDKFYQTKAPLREGVVGFTYGNLMPSFIFGFVVIYCVLALSFGMTLYQLERAWGSIITGLGSPPSRLSYFYFSFLTQATAIPNDVQPISPLGQIWILWIVLTGILLLTIFIASFTTSLGVHGGNVLQEVKLFSEGARKDLIRWQSQLSQPVLEADVIDIKPEPAGSPDSAR